jgi:hypothetical protein
MHGGAEGITKGFRPHAKAVAVEVILEVQNPGRGLLAGQQRGGDGDTALRSLLGA